MSNNPFTPWWYYEIGKDAAKHPNRKLSNEAFAALIICLIIALILLAIGVAACIWYLAS